MLRLQFEKPLTASEIKTPLVEEFEFTAKEFSLRATFSNMQQRQFKPHRERARRVRVGNLHHQNWSVGLYALSPPNYETGYDNSRGRFIIKGPIAGGMGQYGGFTEKAYKGIKPVYSHITVHTPNELEGVEFEDVIQPDSKIVEHAEERLTVRFAAFET
ncbi:MAG TPA: hypothetical protein VLE69_03550 [Candidatus Saccharimonadales bacterium]|nr:hypothetical protein [Candidatus Saccharimonadales bacterium]